MRSTRCAFSTAAALHRIFIAPIEHSLALPKRQILYTRGAPKLRHASIRQLSTPSLPPSKRRLPRDDEIRDYMIRLVSEDNELSPPQYTSSVLNSIDRYHDTLVVVAMPDPNPTDSNSDFDSYSDSDSDAPRAYPICKVFNKKALREAEKAKQKKKEAPSATIKTIELNWAIDAHDLRHRLQRLKDFLGKGFKVNVVMAGKKRGRSAALEERTVLMQKVREAAGDVEGAKEWRDVEGAVGATMTMYMVGKMSETESGSVIRGT